MQEEDLHLENVYYSEMKDAGFFDADWEWICPCPWVLSDKFSSSLYTCNYIAFYDNTDLFPLSLFRKS